MGSGPEDGQRGGQVGIDQDRIPERLQGLVAQLRKAMLQRCPAGPVAQDP